MIDEKARAWVIHYPEDSYYGKAPDELRVYPLTPEEIKDGLEQTPLYALSPGSTGETEGWVLVPKEPSEGLLMSMAIRRDHGLGAPGYYDMLGEGEHEKRLRVAISEARQAHEEVIGSGFYSKERDANYRAILSAAGER